jgi:hypothetical protein
MHPEDFPKTDLATETVKVFGHHPRRPVIGQTIVGEFRRSFIKFEFVDVEYVSNPPDMFFADIKAVDQELKENTNDPSPR